MKRTEFQEMVEGLFEQMLKAFPDGLFRQIAIEEIDSLLKISSEKGADYAPDSDELKNFKDAADRLGLTWEQIWGVYAGKHWDAIMTYCREGDIKSEPIDGRVHDLIVYDLLLLGLIRDRRIRAAGGIENLTEAGREMALPAPIAEALRDED